LTAGGDSSSTGGEGAVRRGSRLLGPRRRPALRRRPSARAATASPGQEGAAGTAMGRCIRDRRRDRARRQGRGHIGAHPQACRPPGLAWRLDLLFSGRSLASDRAGRARAKAVPLPSPLEGGARRNQVRAHDCAWARAAQAAPAGRGRSAAARPAAGEGARDRGPTAGDHVHSRRERGVRAQQQVIRSDHAQGSPCTDRTDEPPLSFSRQERRRTRDLRRWPRARAHRPALPRPAGARALSIRGRRWPPRDDRLRRRQRLHPRGRRWRVHRQRLPNLGGNGLGSHSPWRAVGRSPIAASRPCRPCGEPRRRAGHFRCRAASGQHRGGLSKVLRPPRGHRVVPRRSNARQPRGAKARPRAPASHSAATRGGRRPHAARAPRSSEPTGHDSGATAPWIPAPHSRWQSSPAPPAKGRTDGRAIRTPPGSGPSW